MPRKRPIQLDDLFRLRVVNRVAISPDGWRVAFELKRCDAKQNKNYTQIMIASLDADARESANGPAGVEVRSLTAGKFNYTLPKWSPSGKHIAFLSDREKGQCLFVMRTDGGEALRITEPDGTVQDFSWSPDGSRIAYAYQPMNEREKLERDGKSDEVAKRPQFKHITRLFHKLDGAGWWNGEYTHIWVCEVDGGSKKQLTRGDFDDSEPRWSPDGTRISFRSNRSENPDMNSEHADIFTVKPAGGGLKQLKQVNGSCAGHAWSPDGKWIAYVGACFKRGEGWKYLERVWLLPARGGKPTELTRDVGNLCRHMTIGDVTGSGFSVADVIWSADSKRVYFLVSEDGATRLYSRSVEGRDLCCEIGGKVNVYQVQRSAADGLMTLAIGTQTDPGDVYSFDPTGGVVGATSAHDGAEPSAPGLRRLTHVNRGVLAELEIVEPEELRITSDDVSVQTWMIRPPGFDKRKKYPAILEIHGGPHAQYGYSFFHEMQWLAAQGYVVCFANPRGSSGYGLKYMNCIHSDWGNLDYRDVSKVADWLFARPFVDRKRVGVTGGSYGGYMTNWLVTHTDRFRAAVTQRSCVNFESMFGTSDYGYDLGIEFGGNPWENRAEFLRQSPLTFVKNCRTPLLIEHEEQDHRCPIEQGEQLFASLKVLGRTVEMIRFEGESHGLSRSGRPQNRAERLRRIAAWFERYMS